MRKLTAILALLMGAAIGVRAQTAGLAQGVVTNSRGTPAGLAYIAICQQNATEGTTDTPCSPLATIYVDSGLTQQMNNPFQADGLGNYQFYAPPGLYTIQIYGPAVNLTFKPLQVSGTGAGGGGGGNTGGCSSVAATASGNFCGGPTPNSGAMLQSNAGAWEQSGGSSWAETLSFIGPVTAGQTILAIEHSATYECGYPNGANPAPAGTVTDSQGDTYTQPSGGGINGAGNQDGSAQVFTATAAETGNLTVTAKYSCAVHGLFIATFSSLGAFDTAAANGSAFDSSGAWTASITTNHADIVIGAGSLTSSNAASTNVLTDTTWNVLPPTPIPFALNPPAAGQFYAVGKSIPTAGANTITFSANAGASGCIVCGASVYLFAFQSTSPVAGPMVPRTITYSDLPNNGSLVLGQTPLTTNGDVMTVASGTLARLALGGTGTFLGNCGGALGYCTPSGGGGGGTFPPGSGVPIVVGGASWSTTISEVNNSLLAGVSGAWTTLPLGASGTFLGNCSGSLGYCTPPGQSTFSGDGALISNVNSTGAVTVTLANVGTGYGIWGTTSATGGAPGYHALSSYPAAAFPTLNQNTTGLAGGLTGCTVAGQGDICYWTGSAWARLPANSLGTQFLSESSAGLPSWAASPSVTLQTINSNNATQTLLNFLASSANAIGGVITPSNPSGGEEQFELTGTINPTGGGTGISNPAAHSLLIAEGSSNFNPLTSPSSNGNCLVTFNVTGGAGVDPSCALAGAPWNPQSSGYTIAYSDRAGVVPFTGSSGSVYTIPVHTTAGFGSNDVFSSPNFGTANLTLTPTTDTIDGGATQTVVPNWADVNYSDSSGNWHTIRYPMYGAFPTNCGGSTNALTVANGVFGCNTFAGGTAILASLQEGANTAITSAGNYLQQTTDSTLSQSYSGSGTSGSPFIWTLGVNVAHANTWTATQTFPNASITAAELAAPFNIADTTITTGTSLIAANACTTPSTVTMTGVTTSMAFAVVPSSNVLSVTGWGSNGGLVLFTWPTANTLNWAVCNQTGAGITPGASVTWNVGVR